MEDSEDAPIITLFSRSVLSALPKKKVPTLFQWAKGSLVDLFLDSILVNESLVDKPEQMFIVLEECRSYLKENLSAKVLQCLLKGVNMYMDHEETSYNKFFIFLPFANQYIETIDLTFPRSKSLSYFDAHILKTALGSCTNLTTLIMPKIANDEVLIRVAVTCPHLRHLEVKYSDVTDFGIGALAGYDYHVNIPGFVRSHLGLQDLRYVGAWGICATIERGGSDANRGISVYIIALLLQSLPNLQTISYPKLSEAILKCRNNSECTNLNLDYYIGPLSPERGEMLAEYLPNLARIDINLHLLDEEALLHFKNMKNLRDLRIGVQSFTKPALESVIQLGNQLHTLFLSCLDLKASDLLALRAGLPRIQQLSIAYKQFNADVDLDVGPGWDNLSELEIRCESKVIWDIPKFCTENSECVTTLFIRAPLDKTSKEEDLTSLLERNMFRKLECLFLRVPSLPVSALVCSAMVLCPKLKKVGNMDIWGIRNSFFSLLEEYLEKNNVDLELLTTYDEGMFYDLNAKRRIFT